MIDPIQSPPSDNTVGWLSWGTWALVTLLSAAMVGSAWMSGNRVRIAALEQRVASLEVNLREEVRRLGDKIDENHRQTMGMLIEIKRG